MVDEYGNAASMADEKNKLKEAKGALSPLADESLSTEQESPAIVTRDDLDTPAVSDETAELESSEAHDDSIFTSFIIPFGFAKRNGILLTEENDSILAYCRENIRLDALLEVRRVIGSSFSICKISDDAFELKLTAVYQKDSSEARQMMEDLGNEADLFNVTDELLQETEDLLESEDEKPVIKLINAIFSEAIKEGASDIHIETFETELKVRFRVDGVLREIIKPNRKLANLLVSRIKVMAKLDIAEKRVPQDGRITVTLGGRAVDVRVSTLPSNHGERVVLRLLDKNNAKLNLSDLGMTEANCNKFAELLKKPHGIILVTGPTGSGKSTTLYAGLSDLNSSERNILTVEDPIEYELPGIGQTPVNTKVDMTFARGLRAILRQDPDVVMIGEIRDLETGQIAVQASLTGHLVLSTLHTNTAAGAITRLEDMGIEPFLLSSSILGVLSQRLVRTLCPDCKEPAVATPRELDILGLAPDKNVTIYHPVGCDACSGNGYRGRAGIHELLEVDDHVRELIHNAAGEQAIVNAIRATSPSIRDDGTVKVLSGITSLEEVIRVTREG